MSQPTAGDVHVNRPLTNIAIAYFQDASNFIAGSVFPNIPVSKQSDAYWTIPRDSFNRDEMKIRAPGTESAGGGYTVNPDNTYYCHVRAYHHDIPDQVRANTDSPLDADNQASTLVTHKALINREKNFASKYFTTGVWGTDVAGVAAGPTGSQVLRWSDAASNPIEDIRRYKRTMMEATGFEPNTLLLGQDVLDALYDHPDIIDRVKYGQTPGRPADIDVSDLAQLFKIPRILVGRGIENTAKEGATEVSRFIMKNGALLCHSAPNPGIMVPSAGYTFSWTGFLAAGPMGIRLKRFRMEHLESDRVEIQSAYDQKVVAADLGIFFSTIVSA
jgi:hypothetical protein